MIMQTPASIRPAEECGYLNIIRKPIYSSVKPTDRKMSLVTKSQTIWTTFTIYRYSSFFEYPIYEFSLQ
jgi:hypothetical protein